MNTLLLNIDFTPLRVITWHRAMEGIVSDKLELVEAYPDKYVRSQSTEWEWPAVVRNRSRFMNQKIRLTKTALYARDDYKCQYCGQTPLKNKGQIDKGQLSIDHVIPRALSKHGYVTTTDGKRLQVSSWENLVTACKACNSAKGDSQSMKPFRIPKAPTPREIGKMIKALHPGHSPIWLPYLQLE